MIDAPDSKCFIITGGIGPGIAIRRSIDTVYRLLAQKKIVWKPIKKKIRTLIGNKMNKFGVLGLDKTLSKNEEWITTVEKCLLLVSVIST